MLDDITIATLRQTAMLPNTIGREARAVLKAFGVELQPEACAPSREIVGERAPRIPCVSGDQHPSRRLFMDVVRARVLDACRRYVEYWTRVFTIAAKVIVTFLALSGAVYWFAFFAR